MILLLALFTATQSFAGEMTPTYRGPSLWDLTHDTELRCRNYAIRFSLKIKSKKLVYPSTLPTGCLALTEDSKKDWEGTYQNFRKGKGYYKRDACGYHPDLDF